MLRAMSEQRQFRTRADNLLTTQLRTLGIGLKKSSSDDETVEADWGLSVLGS